MRVLLFGYGEMGAAALEFLLEARESVTGIVTHRDDPSENRWYRCLAKLARAARLDVFLDDELGERLEDLVRRLEPELILSAYYRSLLPMEVLRLAPKGALNLHGSLLPRLRGRAPINWALVEGEARTGVTLHHMVAKADAGDIVAQRAFDIGPRDTAITLFRRAVEEARHLLREVWPAVRAGTAPRVPQDPSRATYRGPRTPEDGRIDWTWPTRRIDGLVRAVAAPFPGAFTHLEGRKLMIWAGSPVDGEGPPGMVIGEDLVATGDGGYRIDKCEFAGEPTRRAVLRRGISLGGET